MAWCIWVLFAYYLAESLMQARRHGTEKRDKDGKVERWNFLAFAIHVSLQFALMYFGGAFHAIGLN